MERFKQHLTESSKEMKELISILKQETVDMRYVYPWMFDKWVKKHYGQKTFDEYSRWNIEYSITGIEIDLQQDYWEDTIDSFPNKIIKKFQTFIDTNPDKWKQYINAWYYQDMSNNVLDILDDKPLKKTTWLVHYTDFHVVKKIVKTGFKGIQDPKMLATTLQKNKEYDGYNFAFHSDYPHSEDYGYADSCIMFQSEGVKTHHYGDQEEQIIFKGNNVDQKKMILISREKIIKKEKHDGITMTFTGQHKDWRVFNKKRRILFRANRCDDCIKWVKKNYKKHKDIYQ